MPFHSIRSKIISSSYRFEVCDLQYDAKKLPCPKITYELIYNFEYIFSNNMTIIEADYSRTVLFYYPILVHLFHSSSLTLSTSSSCYLGNIRLGFTAW